ncbi:hypothetical protein APHAL10511_002133 [Amanita phalloides]|nr:hypothetical protein APHAL10511_002133 [Amanita phalloides]
MSLFGFACAPAKRLFFSIQVRNNEEDMSKSRSASVDASKPEERESLANVMDAAFQSNSKHDEDGEKSDDHDGPDASQPDIQQPEGYTLSAVYPPQPCDRCIRANKTCRGIAGARCEHCKRLKQKCSNFSNAPPRGRHAAAAKNAALALAQEKSRPKRKVPSKALNGDVGSEDETDELDDDQSVQPTKKRRMSKAPGSAGDRKAYLSKMVKDVETQIARVVQSQVNTEREVKKLQEKVAAMSAVIQESDEE